MPRRARQVSESGIYHVMLRGINRQDIFLDHEDRTRFLHCLLVTKQLSECRVLAYCLMSNHVHLVLRTTSESIGQVVKRLGVRYAGWHNQKYGRVGHLFQDRFKSIPVEDDAYLIALLRYVWNNPVAAGLAHRPDTYPWSSAGLIGRSDGLVEERDLLALMSVDTVTQLATQPTPDAPPPRRPAPAPLLPDAEAAALVAQMCQAFRVDDVTQLPPVRRARAIAELLEQGMSTRQLARLSGLSQSSIVRVAQFGQERYPGGEFGWDEPPNDAATA